MTSATRPLSSEPSDARPNHAEPLPEAPIGVIGGSGLETLLDPATSRRVRVETPYGDASADVVVGALGGRAVAFLPRHGAGHRLAPHEINARANVWALARLGVRAIVSTSAVGSLDAGIRPETFVVPDQLLDRTHGRADTYYGGGEVQHLRFADPFCPVLSAAAAAALERIGERVRAGGTTAVVQGPRFSTRAESRWLRQAGAHLVNMTQYPETALAAELNVGVVNLSFVTDLDAGDDADDAEAASAGLVFERMARGVPRIRAAVAAVVAAIPADYAPRRLVDEDAAARVRAGRGSAGLAPAGVERPTEVSR